MSKLKQRILTVAIAIMLVLFIGFGIDTFYKPPEYNDFCSNQYGPYPVKEVRVNCTNEAVQTQTLIDSCNTEKGYLSPKYDDSGCVASYYCETCQIAWDDANKKYNGVVFTFALILGIISMVIAVILKNDTVSPGILGGGFLSILYGTIRDWSNLGDYLRLGLLGVALAILIWIGYKKMSSDEEKPSQKRRRKR
jgi:FtsH-binding integral membrane protein